MTATPAGRRTTGDWTAAAVIFGLWFLCFALPIGNRSLWAPDEPRYTQVSWEMLQNNSFLVPLLNGEPYAHKPPLFFWLTMLAATATGFETAGRWVSALASLGTILLTWRLGRRSGGGGTGFTAALLLMSCYLYMTLSGTGNIDTLLTLAVTTSFYAYYRWDESLRPGWLWCAYAACGLGILAKGPAGFFIPWLAFIAWEFLLRRGEAGRRRHLAWGPGIALAVAALWVLPACFAGGPEYAEALLIKQTFGRAVGSFAHSRPWYYLLVNFPLLALPWFLLLPAALGETRSLLRDRDRRIGFFILWFAVVVVFFTLVSGKRGRYLLPAFPAFAVFLAHAVGAWGERRAARTISVAAAWGLSALALLAVMLLPPALPLLAGRYPELGALRAAAPRLTIWGLYLAGAAAALTLRRALPLLRSGAYARACRLTALALLLMIFGVQLHFVPRIDALKSVKPLAERLAAAAAPGSTMAFLGGRSDQGWNYYLRRGRIPVVMAADLGPGRPAYDFLIREEGEGKDTPPVVPGYELVLEDTAGHKYFFILSKTADPAAPGDQNLPAATVAP